MHYFIKNKKILFSIFLLIFFLICFYIFNEALKKNNTYFPKLNDDKDYYLNNFRLPELYTNNKISFDELAGKKDYSIINIWASWCLPCREENKFLISLSKIETLQIIGINYKDKKSKAKLFLNELGNPFNHVLVDYKGTTSIDLGAYGVPETFLVDKNKKVLLKIIGPINNDQINEIEKIINK